MTTSSSLLRPLAALRRALALRRAVSTSAATEAASGPPPATSQAPPPKGAYVLPMPKLSPQMQRGAIAAWRVKEGGAFPQYTILCEVSTTELVEPIFAIDAFAGRVRMLVEAQQAGIVVRFLRQPGQDDDANDLPVGTPLAVVVAEDDLDDAEDDAARQEMLEAARAWEVPTTDVLDDAQPRVPVLEWQSFLAEGGGGEGGAGGGGGGGGGCM